VSSNSSRSDEDRRRSPRSGFARRATLGLVVNPERMRSLATSSSIAVPDAEPVRCGQDPLADAPGSDAPPEPIVRIVEDDEIAPSVADLEQLLDRAKLWTVPHDPCLGEDVQASVLSARRVIPMLGAGHDGSLLPARPGADAAEIGREKMRGVVMHRTGGPEVLVVEELPVPAPGAGELLIRTEASGINFAETRMRSGALQPMAPDSLPTQVGGVEGAGTVVAVGRGWTQGSLAPACFVPTATARTPSVSSPPRTAPRRYRPACRRSTPSLSAFRR
jgi:hypothetical protein